MGNYYFKPSECGSYYEAYKKLQKPKRETCDLDIFGLEIETITKDDVDMSLLKKPDFIADKEVYLQAESLCIKKVVDRSYITFNVIKKHKGKQITTSLQRFIIKNIFKIDIESTKDVTFKENIGFDFRLVNLRFIDRKFRSHLNNVIGKSSKYKGVRKTKQGKYEAKIHIDNKTIWLGLFNTQEEAAKVYNIKARELFGKFAYQNEIKKGGKKCPPKQGKTT
jgi:hypothetical protein